MKSSIHDCVIVGAGSAGCVLAHRLSSEQTTSVLLLEAGGRATGLFKDMPIAFPRYVLRRDLNWNFQSEPEPYADNRVIDVPRGKAIGGSSAIYGMVYARGHRLDYDDWARAGLSGWSYADVLPYFRLSERSWLGEGRYHGSLGPLEVCIPKGNLMYDELRAATLATGYPVTDDYHGENKEGGANSEGLQRNEMVVTGGRRGNVARTFLRPVMHRSNLDVVSKAQATRVVFEGTRAVAVEYLKDGQVHVARARQEVILCGGTYGSPQLLMLSGVGPADELAKHGITPLVDLPGVGRNLIEHPFLPVTWRALPGTFECAMRADRAAVSVLRWALFGTGTFATNGAAGNIFLRTEPALDRPDMQLICPAVQISAGNVWYPLMSKPTHTLVCALSMIRQDSRGQVTLRSSNPLDPPRIAFNLFQEKSDVERMIRGIRAARAIYSRAPLSAFHAEETLPGDAVQSDAELEKFVRSVGAITQHPVGTCRMGTERDAGAVVDAELRVRGVQALRVIDASVMPSIPGGNTNAPTIMIAEKGADAIRGRRLPPAEGIT
jgi:choline dehydrogenase-like flavoprotein